MKIIDEKGRLFGKINLIDMAVVLVLVFALVAVAWKFVGDDVTQAIESAKNIPPVTIEVVCYDVDPEVAEFAGTQAGTQLMNSGEMLDAYIVDCVVSDSMTVMIDQNGVPQAVSNPAYRTLTFTVEAAVEPTANAYAIGTQELRAGKTYLIKSLTLEIPGIITAMEEANTDD